MKDIIGYEGLYAITKDGKVWSYSSKHFIYQKIRKDRRCQVWLYKHNKAKAPLVHRLVAQAFIPNPENKKEVNHIDADPANNKVENLEWCTAVENMRHARKLGLIPIIHGERNGKTFLTESDVREIRKMRQNGLKYKDIANHFGLTELSTLVKISNGSRWIHVI